MPSNEINAERKEINENNTQLSGWIVQTNISREIERKRKKNSKQIAFRQTLSHTHTRSLFNKTNEIKLKPKYTDAHFIIV